MEIFVRVVLVIVNIWLSANLAVVHLEEIPNYRLPSSVLPSAYNLTLRPYLLPQDGAKQFTFDGNVFIDVIPQNSLNEIVLHSKYLNYSLIEYWDSRQPDQKFNIANYKMDNITEKFILTLSENMISQGSYTIHFTYVGQMDDDMYGFYRSSYIDEKNRTKWLASTQFETHHARRAFPCFDEPKFKATFQLTILHHRSFKTVSNTRMSSSNKIDSETYADVYEKTPPMSTYLVAFLVSEFNERSNEVFAVVARPEYYDQTSYSFEVGQKLLEQFDKYLSMPFYNSGIDKMHLAAIPDFSAGAMENWGLVTFRERAVLSDQASTSSAARQSIATIIAHEQAHMWFGDIVTCEWWSYAWLNEGFATFFQYMMTAGVHLEWELEKQFVVDQLQTVFEFDSTNKTNPMSDTTATNFDDLKRMFNSISYNKGGTIIRMIQHSMGEQAFQRSLQEYLIELKYKNAVPDDIFRHWENNWPTATKQYARKIFESFTTQVGYPLITVNLSTHNNTRTMEITQKRFLLNADDGSDSTLLYTIPFTYTTSKDTNFSITIAKHFLDAKHDEPTKISVDPEVDWVIANIQQIGYYRVNYDEISWLKIRDALTANNSSGIHVLNRAQIVNDLFNLARSGEIAYTLALQCLEYLKTETNYIPWVSALNGYNYLGIRLGTEQKNNFANYILRQIDVVYKKLGFEENQNDSTLDVYNRNKVLSWACKYGNQECIAKALNIINDMETIPVPVNIRSVVYCNAMREGNEEHFNYLFNKFKSETIATEQTLIISCLGCVKDSKLVEKYFNIIVSNEIRRQDKASALYSLFTQNPENVSPVFLLVTTNCDKLAESMGSYSAVASVIHDIANLFTTEEQKNVLEIFNRNNKHKFGTSAVNLENAEKTVSENLLWAEIYLGDFVGYLEEHKNGAVKIIGCSFSISALLFLVAFWLT